MMGGIDVRMPSTAGRLSLEVATQAVRQAWPEAVIEDVVTGDRYDSSREIPFGQIEEIFVYRDAAAAAIWDAEGAVPRSSNTMIHLVPEEGWVTAVVDERTEEMDGILASIGKHLTESLSQRPASKATG